MTETSLELSAATRRLLLRRGLRLEYATLAWSSLIEILASVVVWSSKAPTSNANRKRSA